MVEAEYIANTQLLLVHRTDRWYKYLSSDRTPNRIEQLTKLWDSLFLDLYTVLARLKHSTEYRVTKQKALVLLDQLRLSLFQFY